MRKSFSLIVLFITFLVISGTQDDISDLDSRRSLKTYTSTNSGCVSCIQNSSKKYWSKYTQYSGYCWLNSENASGCGGSSYDMCSNDNDIDTNGEYILCPKYSTAWGTQSKTFDSTGDYYQFSSNFISTSNVCVYKLDTYAYYGLKYFIKLSSKHNWNVYVYTEPSDGKFDYKGSMSSGSTMTVSVGSYDDVFVVVIPTANNAYVTFNATSTSKGYSGYDTGMNNRVNANRRAEITEQPHPDEHTNEIVNQPIMNEHQSYPAMNYVIDPEVGASPYVYNNSNYDNVPTGLPIIMLQPIEPNDVILPPITQSANVDQQNSSMNDAHPHQGMVSSVPLAAARGEEQ